MNWIDLHAEDQLQEIKNNSFKTPQIIFKHSTRCSISSMAKNRLDKSSQPDVGSFYYLALLKYRNISNGIVETFKIPHQSPQVLIIKDGACTYDESHGSITMDDISMHL